MTMARAAAAAILAYQFSTLASEISQAASDDSATGYGPDLDQALRALGVAEADLSTETVADDDVPAYLALAEYYALRRFARRLALRADVKAGPLAQSLSQQAKTIMELMNEAAERAAGLGYPVTGSPAWSTGMINLDYLEPTPTT